MSANPERPEPTKPTKPEMLAISLARAAKYMLSRPRWPLDVLPRLTNLLRLRHKILAPTVSIEVKNNLDTLGDSRNGSGRLKPKGDGKRWGLTEAPA